MAYRTVAEANAAARKATEAALKESLTGVEGTNKILRLNSINFGTEPSSSDYSGQKKAKIGQKVWGTPVHANMSLIEKDSGKVLDTGDVKLMTLPTMTERNTYLYGGQEYQFDTQFRRKPGVYTRVSDRGEYVSQISADGKYFRKTEIYFDPATQQYSLVIGTSEVPLATLIDLMGITKSELEAAVGADVARTNAIKPKEHEYAKLYKSMFGEEVKAPEDISKIAPMFYDSKFDPKATDYTLGKPIAAFDKTAVLAVMSKLLKLARNEDEEDDPNSLVTKDVLNYDDYIKDWIGKSTNDVRRRIVQRMPDAKKVEDVFPSGIYDSSVSKLIMSPLAQRREQYNLLDILSGATRTTVRGPGGISDPNMVRDDMRTIHPSHIAFLDPIQTPEGAAIGTTLHLAQNAFKDGNDLKSDFIDLKTGKEVKLSARDAYTAVIAFPDCYDLSVKPPKAKSAKVSAAYRGEIDEYPTAKVQYVPATPSAMFSSSANTIPFLRSNIGVRAMTASRQMEQAIPLVNREIPLVQVRAGASDESIESLVGRKVGATESPAAGTVSSVKDGAIKIKGDDGKDYVANYYENFPLNNDKSYITSDVKVKPGDKVKKGQLLCDSNYTKDGVLATGTNLHVAYVAIHGATFEDAVAISESAAKKLTSDHMHQYEVEVMDNFVLGKKKFASYYPNNIDSKQLEKIDEDGVVREGEVLNKGDYIFVGLAEKEIDPDSEMVLRVSKNAVGAYSDKSIQWEKQFPGTVTEVHKVGKRFVIHVKTEEPATVGDKVVGKYGNKGIISKIYSDAEMLKDSDGNAFDIVMNPAGIVGRVNLGQVYETVVGKAAKKTGKPVVIDNYDDSEDAYDKVQRILKSAGVSDTEIVTDPKEGPSDQPALTGYQYMFKLTHQVDKKLGARGALSDTEGRRLSYSMDMTPARGGEEGGQGIGILDTYALLSHGASANIQDIFSFKGDAQNSDYWMRLKSGDVLPEPEVPYTSKKFVSMLHGMGVNTRRSADTLQMMPMTDKDVRQLSAGALTRPGAALDFKNRPEKGGIFDSITTGGLRGSKYSHIELPEPVMNPISRDAVTRLLAFRYPEQGAKLLDQILDGEVGIASNNDIVPIAQAKYVTGKALKRLLDNIDVDNSLASAEQMLKSAPESKINVYNKTVKYLRALKALGYRPGEAYMLTVMPVVPPEYRPIAIDPNGQKVQNDVNDLYKKLGETVEAMGSLDDEKLPPEARASRGKALSDMVDAVMVSGYNSGKRPLKSFMQQIIGTAPKYGYFQSRVLKRRQDVSGKSTIIPSEDLHMDQVAVPEKMLWETYSPFVTRSLVKSGYSTVDAATHVKDKSEVARSALMTEIQDRPVLLKRNPVLHKFGIQALYPVPTAGSAIKIPHSITAGLGADFDGDTVSIYVPSTDAARDEAKELVPSRNIFSPKGGGLMHKPDHEAQLGLYLLTEEGKKTNFNFTEITDAYQAYKNRQIKLNDTFMFSGKRTSLGRLMLANVLPKGKLQERWYSDIAYNPDFKMDKKAVGDLLKSVGQLQPQEFPTLLKQLRSLGDTSAFKLGSSFSLADVKPMKHLNAALPKDSKLTETGVGKYIAARAKVEDSAKAELTKNGNRMMKMVTSGARGNWDQLKQIVLSPGLMTNSKGDLIPSPVNKSYSQGLSLSQYWTTLHGARRGMVSKSRGTALPGYLTRQMQNSVADVKVTEDDCHTQNGVYESVQEKDVIGRYLAAPQKVGKVNYKAGTVVDSVLAMAAKTAGVQNLFVRTPLKCETHDGICAKCYGKWHDGHTPPIGTNIGVISAQSLGEPTTQMSMKLFHEGGLYSPASKTVDAFKKTQEILEVPLRLKAEAVLSTTQGSVQSVMPTGTGWDVTVAGVKHFVPSARGVVVKPGQMVKKGDRLSGGDINPHTLSALSGVGAAQQHLVGELHSLYKPFGVDKRHMETVVRYMTDMGLVQHASPDSGFARGDLVPLSRIDAFNKKQIPLDWAIGKKLGEAQGRYPAGTTITPQVQSELRMLGVKKVRVDETGTVVAAPVIKGVNTLPLVRSDDPLSKMSFERLKDSIEEGALLGQTSDLSGSSPLTAIGFGSYKPPKVVVGKR